jgi:hypothetical protein
MILHGNAPLALAASASWGGGDYTGGRGVQAAGGTTAGALKLVIVAYALSLAVLLGVLWLRPEPWPHGMLLAWGVIGGSAQAISLTAFYVALSRGAMGASAAVSGLIAATIPAVFSSVIEGSPGLLRLAGFVLAGGGDMADRRWADSGWYHTRTPPQDHALGRHRRGRFRVLLHHTAHGQSSRRSGADSGSSRS